jgi:hypothetical protein
MQGNEVLDINTRCSHARMFGDIDAEHIAAIFWMSGFDSR